MNGSFKESTISLTLWLLLIIYACARVLQIFPEIPIVAVVALHVLPPVMFALIHGTVCYGLRNSIAFVCICLLTATVFETLALRTGFPFGHYFFTDVMGPKIAGLPILLAFAYVGMAYLSWTLARLILSGGHTSFADRRRLISLPLVAAFLMVAWDLSMEPVWATIVRAWIWLDGGSYFGVPISNFLGWYINVYVFYQLFAIYLTRRRQPEIRPVRRTYWHQAILFYAISAAGNLLLMIPRNGPQFVLDPVGVKWSVTSITSATALVSIFTMGTFAVMAWVRTNETPSA